MTPLAFEIAAARAHPTAAAPTVGFKLRVRETAGGRVDAVALRTQIMIQPRKRHYAGEEERNLVDVFGEAARWGETLHPLLWTHVDATVPSFSGETEVELLASCGYDFDIAANRYLDALGDGEIPLLFLFSGTIFGAGERGLQVARVPWELEAAYRLPVAVYREAMNVHFPNAAWIRMHKDTFDELNRFKSAGCFASWERAFEALLEAARTRR